MFCNSCWALAAASVLSDRIKIARKAKWPDIIISAQVLLSCGEGEGCDGGNSISAFKWMQTNEITDETCAPYRARGHTNGSKCGILSKCMRCRVGEPCDEPEEYKVYGTQEYGRIKGEAAMMQEIY